jgi:hypothetical protein
MKKLFLAALFLTLQLTHAQYDYGLEIERDVFTNEFSCSQRVDNSIRDDSGIMLSYNRNTGYGIAFIRDFKNDPNTWVFNSLLTQPLPGDYAYIRFPNGEVISGIPDAVYVENSPQRIDAVIFYNVGYFIYQILNSTDDILIRFVGTYGRRDFKINKEVIFSLVAGFGSNCLGLDTEGEGI